MRITVHNESLAVLCRRWRITEFALFGSALREDFRPDSDIDVLLTFEPDAPWDLWDIMDLQEELNKLFGRKVDIVEKKAITNPYRKREILRTSKVFYAA